MILQNLSSRSVGRGILSLSVVVLAGYVLASLFNVSRAVEVLLRARLDWFAIGVVTYYATFPVRTARWRRLLQNIDIDSDRESANVIVLVNFYLNMLVPAKLGDLYRSRTAARLYGDSGSGILGTVVAERVIDLTVLAAGLAVALPLVLEDGTAFRRRALFWTGSVLVVLFVGATLVVYANRLPLPDRVLGVVANFRRGFTTVRKGSVGTRALIWGTSFAIWSLNVVRTWAVANALDIHLDPWGIVLLALLVAFLSGLPYLPAGVGVVEVIGSSVLVTLGLSGADALALVLLDRVISVGLLVGPGTLVYLYVSSRGIPRGPTGNRADSME